MIVEFGWKSVGPECKVHPLDRLSGGCFFCWVPMVEQLELDMGGGEQYLDKVVSVSGLVEVEGSSRFSDQSLLSF